MKCYFKHGRSRGLKLVRFRAWQVELWWVPVGETIEPHTHPNCDSWLWFMFGECYIHKKDGRMPPLIQTKPVNIFNLYSIPCYVVHWFSLVTEPLLFLNFQKWLNNTPPSSASVDFKTYGT